MSKYDDILHKPVPQKIVLNGENGWPIKDKIIHIFTCGLCGAQSFGEQSSDYRDLLHKENCTVEEDY